MYVFGLHNGQWILINYYMLIIMFHLNGTVDSEENALHIQCIISCIKKLNIYKCKTDK